MAQSKKSSNGLIILVLFVVGSLAALGIFLYIKWKKKQVATQEANPQPDNQEVEPDPDAMIKFYQLTREVVSNHYGTIDENKVDLLTAQAAFETGDFTSPIYQENYNAFGMRNPKVRATTSLGDKSGYAYYASVTDSIEDRLLWDDNNQVNYEGFDVTKFCQAIYKLGYFTDSFLTYKNGVNAYAKKLLSLKAIG